MKNRKNVLFVLVALAILCLGIGYAALTDTLEMTGTVLADGSTVKVEEESRFDVDWLEFGQPTNLTGNVTFQEGTINDEDDTATFTVSGFTTKGDTIWVHASFINNSAENLSAAVNSQITVEGEGKEKFNFAYYISSTNDPDKNSFTELAQGAEGYLTILISLTETLINSDDISLTIKVKLVATDC